MVVEHQDVYQNLLDHVAETLWNMTTMSSSSSATEAESSTTHEKTTQKKANRREKRQTPLINAGYAARVLTISNSLSSFITYHSHHTKNNDEEATPQHQNISSDVQIVVMGCGVDVISLWAAYCMVKSSVSTSSSSRRLRIIEIDTPEICALKKEVLLSTDDKNRKLSVKELYERQSTGGNHLYYEGTIYNGDSYDCGSSSSTSSSTDPAASQSDYLLIPADLTKNLDQIESIINNHGGEEVKIPTFVLSELVLSYIQPKDTDNILQWCSNYLCQVPGSVLLALEPLGSSIQKQNTKVVSVTEGYRYDYCEKYVNKMERGINNQSQTDNDKSSSFYPIGCSKEEVLQLLNKAGFGVRTSSVCNLGLASSVAAAASSNTNPKSSWKCPEIFDEHAAFILHLKSYAVVCSIVDTNSDTSNGSILFQRYMCPWEWPNAHNFARMSLPLVRKVDRKVEGSINLVITEIERQDEQSVRKIFEETYKYYWDEYPKIRKMVKGVLNKDMAEKRSGTIESNRRSSIAEFYRKSGGIFLVALGEKQDQSNDPSLCYEVLGFVGVRYCESKGQDADDALEIFRLVVDSKARGCGIGRKLLEAVDTFVMTTKRSKLIAHTLTILHDASRLYSSCGYTAVDESQLGDKLIMIRFEKQLAG